ncbi:MAG: cell division protein FtsZ [Candidatus Staskawiczbacteria bacterium]|nr:cell division protein FtsZ [Candidatus Staskawiczbacteria bacterium]
MPKKKNPPSRKASARRGKKNIIKKKKPAKRRKILNKKKIVKKVHPVKSRKAGISAKPKLFNRARKAIKKAVKPKKIIKKIVKRKPVKTKKLVKKLIIKKVHPVKSRKAGISAKPKLFNRARKASPKPQITEFPAESLFKAKIKVIGIGGGGGSIVSEIGRSLEKATFVIADTDIRALKKKSGIKYFWFGEEMTHGLGTGVNVELAKQAAESAKEKIGAFFENQDIIIFVASLGGGLGSGATQVFAEAAKDFGGITFGIFTMPFKFEGKNKQRIALNALKSLRQSLNVSLVIPNEKIFKIIDESTPITNAFSTVNKSLIESLESLIDLIYNPGIINIDFADLRTILKGRGNSAFLNTIEQQGKNRVEKTCENIFKNPLLQNSNLKAEKILFNIVGSENLSMFEVEKISSHISNQNPKAKIIFGISKDSKLKNKIKTTILMTGGQAEEKIIEEKIEPAKLVKPEPVEKIIKKEAKPKAKKPALSGVERVKNKKSVKKKEKQVSIIPVFEVPVPERSPGIPVLEQRRLDVVEASSSIKKTIRRSGLEIKEAEELLEKKRLAQEKEWEIPAFLRKVKFKS